MDDDISSSCTSAMRNNTELAHHDMAQPMIPVVKKFRFSMDKRDLDRVTSQQCYSGPRELVGTARNPKPSGQAIVSIVSNSSGILIP
jgi:hypothetical protein